MKKAQILTEAALALPTLFLLVVGLIIFAYLIAQYSAVQVLVPTLCEAYAESPNISGRVSVQIPYLWLGVYIPLPEMSFGISSTDGTATFSTGPDRTIVLSEVYPPAIITCSASYRLRVSNAPMLRNITISAGTTYHTVRRYGATTDLPAQPSFPRQASSAISVSPLVMAAIIPAIKSAQVLKQRVTGLLKRQKGNALVEYALAAFPILPFIVSAGWAILYIVLVVTAALGGAKTIMLGAMGENPAVIPITFHFGEHGSCSFSPGEPIRCYEKSPFAYAANYNILPSITFGAWQQSQVIYLKYSSQ